MRCGCCLIFVESVNPCTLLRVQLGTGGGDFFSEIGPGSPYRPSAVRPDAQPGLRGDGDPCPHNRVRRRCDDIDEETTHHSKDIVTDPWKWCEDNSYRLLEVLSSP
jgi:hypothetical protein